MLHLAQVKNNKSVGGMELKLLARQHSENLWALIQSEKHIPFPNTDALSDGLLVLVELSNNYEIVDVKPATDWMLDVVQQYLTIGVSPAFLEEEAERREQWRQDLTLQSQDLTRQRAEMEARREQIQTLEEDLRRENQRLEEIAAKLKTKEEDWKQEKQQLEQQLAEMAAKLNSQTDSEDL
jgi:hypothetical protein